MSITAISAPAPDDQPAHESDGPRPTKLRALPHVGRTLPHSLEAEKFLLSCCFLDGADVIPRCIAAKIGPESFYEKAHGLIFEVILALYRRQEPTASYVVAEELQKTGQLEEVGGTPFIAQLASAMPTTVQAGYFIDRVRENWILRECVRFGDKMVKDVFDYTGESALTDLLSPKVEWLRNALSRVVHGGRGGITLEQRLSEVRADVQIRASGKEDRSRWVYTGLEKFDQSLLPLGSDAEDHVVLLGGGSGHGKSALARQFAGAALRRGQRVLNYTRETSVKGYIRQIASHWAQVDLRYLPEAPKDHIKQLDDAIAELEEMANKRFFVFQHEPGCALMTIEHLMTHARDWAWQRGAPELLVVDYLQLFGTEKRCNNREQEVAHVSHQLQALQRELGCVVLVLAQYNETGLRDMKLLKKDESGKIIHRLPNAGDFRESQAMFHDADRVLGLYRPPEDCRGGDQTLGSVLQPEQWIVQIKRRYGGEGFTRCWFKKKILTFEEFGKTDAVTADSQTTRQTGQVPKGGTTKADWKHGRNRT